MDVRVQGGTRGLLSAIAAGVVDPLDAALDDWQGFRRYNGADRRQLLRRERRRRKKAELRDRSRSRPASDSAVS